MDITGLDFGNKMAHASVVRNMDQNRRGGTMYDLIDPDQPLGMDTSFYYSANAGLLTGKDAVRRAVKEGQKPITCVKNLLHEKSIVCNGRSFSGTEIMKTVAKAVLEDVVRQYEENISIGKPGSEPVNLTLGFPATFSVESRDLLVQTLNSIQLKDGRNVQVTGTIAEPAAAALSYLAEVSAQSDEEKVVQVFDLGGGTFDAAVCKVYPNGLIEGNVTRYYDILATDGDAEIGGEKFTEIVNRILTGKLEASGENISARVRNNIYAAAEDTKIELSKRTNCEPNITGFYGDDTITITQEEFASDKEAKRMTARMMDMMQAMQKQYAGHIDMILVTGGASQMPMIHDALHKTFPKCNIRTYKPARAVSYGAARYGVIEGSSEDRIDRVINDKKSSSQDKKHSRTTGAIKQRTPHALGIRCFDKTSPKEYVFEMIPSGTTIPFTSEYFDFNPHTGNQRRLMFKVYESKHMNADKEQPNRDYIQVVNAALDFDYEVEPNTVCCARLSINEKGMLYIEVCEKDDSSHKSKNSSTLNSLY